MTGELVARTVSVDAELDLLALAGRHGVLIERSGHGLAGRGVAARIPLREADAHLTAIRVAQTVDGPGRGAVAFGALPFAPSSYTELLVPEVVWGRDAAGAWVTTIGPPGARPIDVDALCRPVAEEPLPSPNDVRVSPVRPAGWWRELVGQATRVMQDAPDDGLRKVVLARELVVEADTDFDRAVVLHRLRRAFPGCFLFNVEGFLGASPELLVERRADVVRAQPMAGTAPRGGNPDDDARLGAALVASATYRHEHQVTIDMVYDTLVPWCSYLDYEAEPSVIGVANVQHLATMVEGRLSRPAPSVLELVAALHPTPAVSGWPRPLANQWIAAHEGFDRGRYAGTVGWVDAGGNGSWAVSIRCAEVAGRTARLYAGNGIVATSDPDAELAETQAKLLAVLGALTRV